MERRENKKGGEREMQRDRTTLKEQGQNLVE